MATSLPPILSVRDWEGTGREAAPHLRTQASSISTTSGCWILRKWSFGLRLL